jgi:UDP-galactopyranose mutase
VRVAVPHLPHGLSPEAAEAAQRDLLQGLLEDHGVTDYVLWYYTPMALGFSSGLAPAAVVYDCMDELSLFRGAPAALLERESRLLELADLVFTGGQSLYEAKRDRHPEVHAFPSSIEADHFGRARSPQPEPADQADIPRPRLGYFGVIDERIDLDLLAAVADLRPDWQLVMVGPVVKIDPESLPRRANLHYLGMKPYAELPAYLAGWDAALMPFADNESTRFISPTKTPEYLAGGRPVISTPVRDVVRPYGEMGLVEIAAEPAEFVAAVERALARHAPGGAEREAWLARVDEHLSRGSWSRTWEQMSDLIDAAVESRRGGRRAEAGLTIAASSWHRASSENFLD